MLIEKKFDLTDVYDGRSSNGLESLNLEFFLNAGFFVNLKRILSEEKIYISSLKHVRYLWKDCVREAIVPIETTFPEVYTLITKLDMKVDDFELDIKRYVPYLRNFELDDMQTYIFKRKVENCSFRTGRDGAEFLEDLKYGLVGNLKINCETQEKGEKIVKTIEGVLSYFYEFCTAKKDNTG